MGGVLGVLWGFTQTTHTSGGAKELAIVYININKRS